MSVYRIDYKMYGKYRRLWVEAENIEEALKITRIWGVVDFCKLDIKEI